MYVILYFSINLKSLFKVFSILKMKVSLHFKYLFLYEGPHKKQITFLYLLLFQ